MRVAACILIAFALVTAPAYAQDSPPADAKLAAALDLLEANNTRSLLVSTVDTMIAIAVQQARTEHPSLDASKIALFETTFTEEMNAELDSSADTYINFAASVYMQHFTTEELTALAAFYRSDVGKKYIATIPTIMKEMGPEGAQFGAQLAQRAMQRTLDRMKKNGVNL